MPCCVHERERARAFGEQLFLRPSGSLPGPTAGVGAAAAKKQPRGMNFRSFPPASGDAEELPGNAHVSWNA